jgi:hypothetical protein
MRGHKSTGMNAIIEEAEDHTWWVSIYIDRNLAVYEQFRTQEDAIKTVQYYSNEYGTEIITTVKDLTEQKNSVLAYKNNPAGQPVELYDRLLEIRAVKGDKSLWPKERFKHEFSKGARVLGNPDGSLTIKSKTGKPLWKHFDYKKGLDY